ncbi:MAG: hypothetical protein PWR01_1941 [Clostridiales bacterium]|nr:hypothetical protein [Clostridiales bacterium]MDN5280868.1 hypothetical protein [Candidatus Ozemobacter sp.]
MCAMIKKRGLVLLLLLISILFSVTANAALKPEYRRNGECYLLIGEGPTSMRGIYRLNNPERNKLYDPPKYLFKPNSSIGFSVDLERKIYTFSEKVVPGYTMLSEPLKRQVLDSGSTDLADWGYHAYIHYDHRSWGRNTNVYRTGPKNRYIRRNGRGWWPYFRSAGPGSPIPTPAGNPLPNVPSVPLGVYSGKRWYSIPNGSWYSSWRRKSARGGPGGGIFYVVYGDKVTGQPHNWTLYTYKPDNINADAPNYSSNAGSVVAVSYDKKITRQIFAGCLDGCGGASGSGGGVADPMVNDLAFMPPIKDQPSRTYFYSRPEGKSDYTVTLNRSSYAPPSPRGNPIIGSPESTDTYWIGVSMRNVSSDYVYCIGTNNIRNWYKQATNSSGAGINISAVAVSNQWNQKGGIVFAYDKRAKVVYKFERYENDPNEPPISRSRYEGIDVSDLMSLINARADSEIDDIKADGFGSLYFAMSYPSKNVNAYDPRKYFKVNDTIRIYPDPVQDPEELATVWLIYRQQYGKAVFERSIYSSVPKEIGKKVFAERYYNLHVKLPHAGMDELVKSGPVPHNNVENILSSWSAQIGNNDGIINKDDFSYGSKGLYYDYNFGDPGHAKLAVINIPTPPEVISLGGKKSWLDICGPYSDYPVSTDMNSTQQDQNLISPPPAKLSLDTVYFYMVENYPLTTGAWNPTDQPDWDGDGRRGGFITSISDTNSSTAGGSVAYRWRTWHVEDLFGNPVYPPVPYPKVAAPRNGTNTGQDHFTVFYSPVRGKYIITCQVIYDWYDYDLLPFGSTVDDLPSVFRSNAKASPVTTGGMAMQTANSQLNSIMSTPDFKFMQASASAYISYITERMETGANDSYFACVPVVAGVATEPQPIPSDLIARIDRCDGWAPNNVAKSTHWSAASDYHGIVAGKPYFWRINLASQTVLFDDISKSGASRNFIVKKMTTPEYDKDGNQINTLFVNTRGTKVTFDNVGDDLRWKTEASNPDAIELESYLEYAIPDDEGNPKIVKLPLLASSSSALPSKKPIIASTSTDLPPTDPYFAELVIKMTRTILYDLRIKNKDGRVMGMATNIPLRFTLYGKTKVLIVDKQAPKILYAHTKPVNLFADAGFAIQAGKGPLGGNPASVSIRLSDNNPWEAVDKVVGIKSKSTWLSNYNHNQGAPTGAPTSRFNYKPVFAKTLNRNVSLSFDRASRLDSGIVKLFPPDQAAPTSAPTVKHNFAQAFGDMYTHKYIMSGGNCIPVEKRLQREYQSTKDVINGTELYFATIGFRIPLNFLAVDSKNIHTNVLPKGYANNTPGYDDGGKIRPYKFYLTAKDSSGNLLSNKSLNIAIHPRDIHKPNPYGFFTEHKDDTTSYFPLLRAATDASDSDSSPQNVDLNSFKENYFDSNNWLADKTGSIKVKNSDGLAFPYYKALPSLGDNIKFKFTSDSTLDYYEKLIEKKIPPTFIEDNVEFTIGCGVSDNAGEAVATLTFKYIDTKGKAQTRETSSSWTSAMKVAGTTGSDPDIASSPTEIRGLFRGDTANYPMAVPVKIVAEDNARDWDYYIGQGGELADPDNPWSDWKWGPYKKGNDKKNVRTFKTSIPVYGTDLIIRTIDKGMRNK